MDSRIKLVAVTCASLVVATILGIVVLYNISTGRRNTALGQRESIAQQEQQADLSENMQDQSFYEQYQLNSAKDPYAFLDDADFFDEEKQEEQQGENLSLLVSSVQKDIRIHVVDEAGSLVSGVPFAVTITDGAGNPVGEAGDDEKPAADRQKQEDDTEAAADGQSQEDDEGEASPGQEPSREGQDTQPGVYIDEDEDGMIFVTGLTGGDYKVGLNPVEGYLVPQSDTPISVSNEISYTLLSDISFLIKSEDEINAKEEDTCENEAERDADGTETNVRLNDGASIFGIDVSKWNKEIDWKRVKDAGVEFAIIRCGYRGSKTGALVEDPYFEKNIKGAQEAGVRVGIYFFTQAVSPVEAVEEASMVLTLCREYKIAFPMYIDTEGAGGNGRADGLDTAQRTAVVRAFCETIENAGYTAGVYASKSWLENRLHAEELAGYQIWLAQYARNATYEGDYGMWQYTSAGTVDGISTLVDFNVSYMDY